MENRKPVRRDMHIEGDEIPITEDMEAAWDSYLSRCQKREQDPAPFHMWKGLYIAFRNLKNQKRNKRILPLERTKQLELFKSLQEHID